MINQLIRKILLLEQYCILCGCSCQQQICQECYISLAKLDEQHPKCPKCRIYLLPKEIICQNCIENNFQFDKIIACFEYLFPLDRLLQQIKYYGKLEYSSTISKLFWDNVSLHLHKLPDLIIPVPLHNDKLKLRGFNQVNELLREFKQSNQRIPIIKAQRIKQTMQQANLNKQQRIGNLTNAFTLNENLTNLHVAIVDDVVTTGSTVNELAKLCKSLGAKQVDVWCLMRAQH